jgi:hypothetical protein
VSCSSDNPGLPEVSIRRTVYPRLKTEDSRYITDPLGVDAVLKLINRYIADHRELVLGDPECTTAVRIMLERFVRVGWLEAVQMAERMDELFR